MISYLIGIDYKIAKIETREEAVLLKKKFSQFLNSDGFCNARILSTCNRFEIYDVANDKNEAIERLNILKKDFSYFFGNSYEFVGQRGVFGHLLRLACGINSQLKAEGQILEQLKNFSGKEDFPEALKAAIDEAVYNARLIRKKSGLDRKEYNIADLILDDAGSKISSKGQLKVVVAGTGKVAELFAANSAGKAKFYFLAHKNYLKADELAKKSGGVADFFHKIDEFILDADILISATTSPHYILRAEFFKEIMSRRLRQLYVYDLAMPRGIAPESSKVSGVVLKNMDDLSYLFEGHNEKIEKELFVLENFAQEEIKKYKEYPDEANV